ncbi:MAG: YqcC family protein [Ferruginibacter sp.]
MREAANTIIAKAMELEAALRAASMWQKEIPAWVHGFEGSSGMPAIDFAQWLQFVFIPNHLQQNSAIPVAGKKLIVPHAVKYFGDDVKKEKILQLLIEIDAML